MIGSSLVDRVQLSPNHEMRIGAVAPSLLILHYTGMVSGQQAVDWLCNPASRVSCHYLVDDDGSIVQMVSEERRAWHAGQSSWYDVTDVNSASIGIEIQNLGHDDGCPTYPDTQMKRVVNLCLDIMVRHGFAPHQVVGHSDIAPGRKIDPGEAFNWQELAQMGIGQWLSASHLAREETSSPFASGPAVLRLQEQLAALGYGLAMTGVYDNRTHIVIDAVQRRYRPAAVTGIADAETIDIVQRLTNCLPIATID